jgi:DNA-3-methyladenine glycosylase II
MDLSTASGVLTPAAPFDFEQSLDFLGMFAPTRGEQTLAPRTLTKAVMIGGQPVVFRVAGAGGADAPRLEYTLFAAAPITPETQATAADRIAFYLSLDDDLRPFYALGAADPAFAPVIRRLYGYHQVKFLTPFENAAWAILSQRNPMPVAQKQKQALAARFGGTLTVDGTAYTAFPEAAQLADVPPATLREVVNNDRRTEYLAAAARAFSTVDEGWLRAAPYAEVEAWLRGIKGIGAWSAEFILLRGLGRLDRVPITEERLIAAVSQRYGTGQALPPAEVARIAAGYGPWQGYWAHYLRATA